MLKVTKFGGTSMADAGQYRKVREIIQSDSSRRGWWFRPPASATGTTTRSPIFYISATPIRCTAWNVTAFLK